MFPDSFPGIELKKLQSTATQKYIPAFLVLFNFVQFLYFVSNSFYGITRSISLQTLYIDLQPIIKTKALNKNIKQPSYGKLSNLTLRESTISHV